MMDAFPKHLSSPVVHQQLDGDDGVHDPGGNDDDDDDAIYS